ncbi:MAG: hypothetical protein NTZ25_05400 [Candidatus Peregrinibacteria bacterium]|nr:hypothetical protein [Candidatus Peregrinibacteria bacterium]
MANFDYKQAFVHVNIDITKEMIAYKGKTIPAQDIVGIGMGFTDIAKVAIGQALGGIAGGVIAQKGYNGQPLKKNLSELPKSRFAQMIITYMKDGKQKFIRVPLTTMDETCVKMIHEVVKEYSHKFIGFGGLPMVEKELKISEFWAFIAIAAVVLLIIVGIVYAAGPQVQS